MVIDFSDIVALTVAAVSLSLTVRIFSFTKEQSKKTTTLHLHQIWTSESMRITRATVYSDIRKRISENGKIPYSSFSEEKLGIDLGSIEHFFADLHHLIASKSVDNELSQRLFGSAVQAWFDNIFSHIEYDVEEEVDFYLNEISPLARLLKCTSASISRKEE